MINATVPTGVAGRVVAQVYRKDADGNKEKVVGPNKSCRVDNIITQLGLDSIDAASLSPSLRHRGGTSHYIALGEGTQEETLEVTSLVNIKAITPSLYVQANAGPYNNMSERTITTPSDLVNDPIVHEINIWYEFGMPGEPRNYTEIGFVTDSVNYTPSVDKADSIRALTYTLFRDDAGLPTSITVAANEYLLISYTYQIQISLHFPVNVPVTGTGIPGGLTACIYRKDRANENAYSATVGAYYFDSELDFNESLWESNFDKFHKVDGTLFYANLYPGQYGAAYSSDIFGTSNKNTDSVGGLALTKMPRGFKPFGTQNKSVSATKFRVTMVEGEFGASTDTKYIVAWGSYQSNSLVTFNKPIPFVAKYDSITFEVVINYDKTNQPWIDASEIN